MGFVVVLIILVGGGLLLGLNSKASRIEYRLRLVEDELRRQIRLNAEMRGASAVPVVVPAPTVAEVPPEPEPVAEPEVVPEPGPEALPEPEPEVAPEPAMAWATPASRIVQDVASPQDGAEAGPEPVRQAPEPAPPKRGFTVNFEELFGRRLPIWAGGITLAIAGVLIVKYAIDQGIFARIFTPGVQAVCGAVFGFGLIGGAEWAWRKRDKVADPRVSQALSGAGISTLYAALLVAANVYHLIAPLPAFFGLAAVTAGSLWLSLRHGVPSAILGLAGGLAAPALTVGLDANVPMLSVYLGFTIAGLAGVSRMQRWPWLAMLALLGGAGWSLWLIIAGKAFDALGAASVGGFVLLLALAIPLYAFRDSAQRLLRAVSAVIGAAQLAMLVALGGFQPLHWGLFALIALAGQVLAWRERNFALVPTLGAAMSFLLLMIWPEPTGGWLAPIALSLAAIHALPLLARLWQSPARIQRAIELSGIAVAAPVVVLRHFHAPWGSPDVLAGQASLGGAALALLAAALGWKAAERREDSRFALLLTVGGLLLSFAAWFALPNWQTPLWIMAVAIGLLFLSRPAGDKRIEPIAAIFSLIAAWQLVVTAADRLGEGGVLVAWPDAVTDTPSLLRWAGLALGFALFAWRGIRQEVRVIGYLLASALAYGSLAQIVPAWALPVAMALVAAALFLVVNRREIALVEVLALPFGLAAAGLLAISGSDPLGEWQRLTGLGEGSPGWLDLARWTAVALPGALLAMRSRLAVLRGVGEGGAAFLVYGALVQVVPDGPAPLVPALAFLAGAWWSRARAWPVLAVASGVFFALSFGWALLPMVHWLDAAVRSLAGMAMPVDHPELAVSELLRRLVAPALLLGLGLALQRRRAPRAVTGSVAALIGIMAVIAAHTLYRHGFAALFGAGFVATGLAERMVWSGLLLGSGWLLWKRGTGRVASVAAPVLAVAAGAHVLLYSLLLHNPLWSAQAVGGLPLANLLAPLFVALPVSLALLARMRPQADRVVRHIMQPLLMVMVVAFAWASLRHAFHPALLVEPGLGPVEDILRSLLGIALAIGFLVWGIRRHRHGWRIASLVLMLGAVGKVFLFDASGLTGLLRIGSFVVLGFSLIGIGWLYSRQLRRDEAEVTASPESS